MRSIKDNSLLTAATIMALGAGGGGAVAAVTSTNWWGFEDLGHIPTPQNPGYKPRSKSTHKQNARKAQKRKK